MSSSDTNCGECGASDWRKLFSEEYPERRRERDRTVRTVYRCCECGAEGKYFEHQDGGADVYSGAMKQ
jgi:hypothetical protein